MCWGPPTQVRRWPGPGNGPECVLQSSESHFSRLAYFPVAGSGVGSGSICPSQSSCQEKALLEPKLWKTEWQCQYQHAPWCAWAGQRRRGGRGVHQQRWIGVSMLQLHPWAGHWCRPGRGREHSSQSVLDTSKPGLTNWRMYRGYSQYQDWEVNSN